MKTLFKCIFFTLLVLKISNATASYLYTVEDNNFIYACKVTPTKRVIKDCKHIEKEHYGIIGNITKIAVSPNGAYAYFVTTENDQIYHIYECFIHNDTGAFEYCEQPKTPEVFPRVGHVLEDNTGLNRELITVNGTSDKFYILFVNYDLNEHRYKNQIIMCSSNKLECIKLDNNFTNVLSMAIAQNKESNENNEFAYLIIHDELTDRNKVYRCPIKKDGTFNHSSCIDSGFEEFVRDPIYITVAPNQFINKPVYILEAPPAHHSPQYVAFCPLIGTSFDHCRSEEIKLPANYRPSFIRMSQIAFDPYNYNYAYFLGSRGVPLVKCLLASYGFGGGECEPVKINEGYPIKTIAFRKNRPADTIKLHFKPLVK